MQNQSYFQSTGFNRATGRAAESAVKMFFRLLNTAMMGTINFISSMIKMAVGK